MKKKYKGLDQRSIYLRELIIRALQGGGRGHVGSAFSLVEILRFLFDEYLIYRSNNTVYKSRDRFILSKGHGCLALYALLGILEKITGKDQTPEASLDLEGH